MATLLLVCVCATFLAVGLVTSRISVDEESVASDLMMARRQLPIWMACLTLAATWIGGGYINGTAEAVYDSEYGLVWCQAPWCYALSLVIGGLVFARPMRNRGYRTMLDLFEDRHGQRMAGALFIPALIGDLFWTAAILSALGTTLSVLFAVDTSVAVVLSATVVILYTAWGGLWSVACSDVLQLGCIIFGLAITVPFALAKCGGLENVVEQYVLEFGSQARWIPEAKAWSGAEPWAWSWLDSALLLICGGIPWQVYFQRILACRTANTAMVMSVLAGFICFAVALAPALLGAVGTCINWSQLGVAAPETSAVVLPHVLRYAVPPVISMLGLMALIAAVMSSMDSSILSSASMFSWNVFRPLARVPDESQVLHRVLRIGVVVLGSAAVLLALSVKSVYQLWFLSSDLVYVILFPQLVMGLFFRRLTTTGALAGVIVSLTLRSFLGLLSFDWFRAWVHRDSWPDIVTHLPSLTLAMLSSILAMTVVSLMARDKSSGADPAVTDDADPTDPLPPPTTIV
jgi:high affinity choline transporter 7